MTKKSDGTEYKIFSVNIPKKIIDCIDKAAELGIIEGRTEFCRNAIINGLANLANMKEMVYILEEIKIVNTKAKTDPEEAKKYFKWLKNKFQVKEIALLNSVNEDRVKYLLNKFYNIKLT